MSVTQSLCYGSGSLCLGVSLALLLITRLAARYNDNDGVEGCLSAMIVLLPLALGLFLILKAMTA